MRNSLMLLSIFGLLIAGCTDSRHPKLESFELFAEFDNFNGDTLNLTMDLHDPIMNGIIIPSREQTKNGYFNFSFRVKKCDQALYYKIYYQNESYKYPEGISPLDGENFYGSWEEITQSFKAIDVSVPGNSIMVKDSFRIVGNPRTEKLYFGNTMDKFEVHEENIDKLISKIKSNPDWLNGIKEKAKREHRDLETQLFLDALWAINFDANKGNVNNRWKRNPRTGLYKFMLVVVTDKAMEMIPDEVIHIDQTNAKGEFINPMGYFLHNIDSTLVGNGVTITVADKWLKLNAKMNLGSGIFVDLIKAGNKNLNKTYYNQNCNESSEMFRKAHFAQYFHYINKNWPLNNIPVIADVTANEYTDDDYKKGLTKYDESSRLKRFPSNSDCPCKTVKSDPENNLIELINPGNKSLKDATKQNVGIVGRIGFTYGKITAKIDFPEQINSTNVWNGITNAFWMIYQDESEWNKRQICEGGYIPKALTYKDNIRKTQINYSEIDFEIVKASKFWTQSSYPYGKPFPQEDASLNNDIIVACTNWDLGCRDPKKYAWGVYDIKYDDGRTYQFHRWDEYYKATSIKVPVPSIELTQNKYYYYQIDWQPGKIIWRIGPEKDQLREIACVDSAYSMIPNNQMVMVVTQEFHFADWWPTTPYKQDFIPYPKNDIVGKVLEITVE